MKIISHKTLFVFFGILVLNFGNTCATTYNYAGVFSFNFSDPLQWSSQVVPPNPLPSGDIININAYCVYDIGTPLTINAGATLNINENGILVFNSSGLINNSSTSNTKLGAGGNHGTLVIRKGVTFINNNKFTNNGFTNNYGIITNYGNNGFINNGHLITHNGSIHNGTNSFENNGSIQLDSGLTTFSQTIDLAVGSLIQVGGGGNYGPAKIIINSATQDFTSTQITFNIFGNGENDKIILPYASAILSNSTSIKFSIWYQPVLNDSFTLIDAANITSTPANIDYPYLPPELEWETIYLNGDLVIKVVTSQPSSISETTLNESLFNIYPNPTSDIINFDIADYSEIKLSIYTTIGSLVKSELLKHNQRQINIGDLSNGIYVVEIKSEDWSEKQRLIIQR